MQTDPSDSATAAARSKPGKSLEELVAKLERILANEKVAIESPKRLRDKVTGRLREHDVVLTVTEQHHTLIVGIECRDRSRKVGVNEIEAFHLKCQHTGINKGVVVSAKGFTEAAREKATHLGIRCLDLKVADQFNWLLKQSMPVVTTSLGPNIAFTLIPVENLAQKPAEFEVIDAEGNLVSLELLQGNVQSQIQRFQPLPDGTHRRGIQFQTPGFALRDRNSGRLHPIMRIDAVFEVVVATATTTFQLVSYEDLAQGEGVIAQTALAPIVSGGIAGDLVMSQRPGGPTEIKFLIREVVHPKASEAGGSSQTVFKGPSPSEP